MSLRVEKVRSLRSRRVPQDAGEDAFGNVAEVRAASADLIVAGAREEQDFSRSQQGRVDREHLRIEIENIPSSLRGWVVVEPDHSVKTTVLGRRVVDHQHEQLL